MGRGFAAQLARMPGITLSAVLDVASGPSRGGDSTRRAHRPVDATTLERADQAAIDGGGSVALTDLDALGSTSRSTWSSRPPACPTSAPRSRVETPARRPGTWRRSTSSPTSRSARLLRRSPRRPVAIYSVCRGDEPVEAKILVDYARDLSFEVVCAGKGKNNPLDQHATPESLAAEARRARA